MDKFANFIKELRKSDHIKILGPDLKNPMPEDFGLESNQLSIAQADYIENEKIRTANKKIDERDSRLFTYAFVIGLLIAYISILRLNDVTILVIYAIGLLIAYSFLPRTKKLGILGMNYARYLEAQKAYEEVLEDIEEEKIEEAGKKEASYWFSLGGHEFEEEISKLLERSSTFSSVERTKGSGDGGVDIILTISDLKIFVQCKAHKAPVGPHVARDLYGAMQSAGAESGLIINLGGFTQGVRDFIKGKNISLFDVNSVVKMQNRILREGK